VLLNVWCTGFNDKEHEIYVHKRAEKNTNRAQKKNTIHEVESEFTASPFLPVCRRGETTQGTS